MLSVSPQPRGKFVYSCHIWWITHCEEIHKWSGESRVCGFGFLVVILVDSPLLKGTQQVDVWAIFCLWGIHTHGHENLVGFVRLVIWEICVVLVNKWMGPRKRKKQNSLSSHYPFNLFSWSGSGAGKILFQHPLGQRESTGILLIYEGRSSILPFPTWLENEVRLYIYTYMGVLSRSQIRITILAHYTHICIYKWT